MNKTTKSTISLFIVSAILIALLFNIKLYWYVLELLEAGKLRDLRGDKRLHFGLVASAFHFIIFSLAAFFNYSWKDKLIGLRNSKTVRILWIILFNLIIYFLLSYLESLWLNNGFDFKGKIFPLDYFLFSNFPVIGLGVAEAYIMVLLRKVRISEIEKTRLREEKANAELAALKDQISPHFFFNTLSSLSTVVRNEKKELALEFIQELSNTYRYTLASNRQDLVTLKEELNFVKSYLFLLKKRFGDKLLFNIEIEESIYQTKLPPMSLQFLVENAVQHNVMTQNTPLTIKFFVTDKWIVVENNLQEKKGTNGLGLGLKNLSSRYRLLAQKDIVIEKDEHQFRVKLPLL